MNKTIIECECGTHLLQVEAEAEFEGSLTFYLAMFNYGNQKQTFFRRLKNAWRCLKGVPFADQLVLNDLEAAKLQDFIQKNRSVYESAQHPSVIILKDFINEVGATCTLREGCFTLPIDEMKKLYTATGMVDRKAHFDKFNWRVFYDENAKWFVAITLK
jgi:hypothetical protein